MEYAKIIDKGECMSTLYTFPQIPWPEPFLKDVANKIEWAKYNFYPSNGLVAEVPYIIKRDMSRGIDIDVFILRINNRYYVPMTGKGIQFITESEYKQSVPNNVIKDMDYRQQQINGFDDFMNSLLNRK